MINKFQIIIYLEMILKKQFKQMSIEELIDLLPNLKSIIINNSFVNKNIIDKIKKLKLEKIEFKNCGIENNTSLKDFNNLKELKLINCDMLSYEILKDLSKNLLKVRITNPMDEDLIDLNDIKDYINLEELIIEKCKIKNTNSLENFHNLKLLSLLNSNIDDINQIAVISKLDNLSDVYVPVEYKDENVIKSLNKNVYFDTSHLVFEEKVR